MSARVIEYDRGFERIRDALAKLGGYQIGIGFQGPSGAEQHSDRSDATVAEVALFQEFGTDAHGNHPGIPERSFLRSAILEQQGALLDLLTNAINATIDGADPLDELAKIGKHAARFVRERLVDAPAWAEPLAASTVRRKGHDIPLRETDKMVGAITWAIRDGDTIIKQGR